MRTCKALKGSSKYLSSEVTVLSWVWMAQKNFNAEFAVTFQTHIPWWFCTISEQKQWKCAKHFKGSTKNLSSDCIVLGLSGRVKFQCKICCDLLLPAYVLMILQNQWAKQWKCAKHFKGSSKNLSRKTKRERFKAFECDTSEKALVYHRLAPFCEKVDFFFVWELQAGQWPHT